MISWNTKTLFEGLFPCPSYRVKQALKAHEDLHCFYEGKEMIIREMDLEPKKLKESEMYEDKSGMNDRKPYQLYYYNWNPITSEDRTKEMLYY